MQIRRDYCKFISFDLGGHVYNKGAPAVLTITQSWYHKRISREDAEKRLREMNTNSFLVRESTKESGKLVLSVINKDKLYHFIIERGVGSYQVQGTDQPFSSVVDLINYYKQHDLSESDTGEVVRLKSPCIFADASRLPGHTQLHTPPTPGPRPPPRSHRHLLASETTDSLHSTSHFKCSPLRNSVSTGNILESIASSSSSPSKKVLHRTHVCLFVPVTCGKSHACMVEDEQYQSQIANSHGHASGEVLPQRE